MQDYSQLERFGVHYCHPTPDPPVRISPDASLPGILAWAERLLGAADRLDGPPIITSNVETLAGRGILGDSWRLPSPHPSERRPLSSLDPVAE